MMIRRATGIAMLLVETVLLWVTMGLWPVGAAITLTALIGCFPQVQFSWRLRRRAIAMGAVAVAFYGLHQLGAFEQVPLRPQPVEAPGTLAGALCFMSLQAMQFYWRRADSLPQYYPLFGIVALAYSADHFLDGRDNLIAFVCAMTFGVLVAVFYANEGEIRDGRRPRWLLRRYIGLGLCLLISFGLAGGTAWGLKNSDRAVAQWMANRALLQRIGLGNSSQSRLNSITDLKTRDRDHIALQIEAEQTPGYLRGQVYSEYQNDTWSALPLGASARLAEQLPEGYIALWSDATAYEVQAGATRLGTTLTIYPGPEIDRALFAPLETGWLVRRGGLQINAAGVLQSPGALSGQTYQALTTVNLPVAPISESDRALYTSLPSNMDHRLWILSDSVCAGLVSNQDKARAVAQYFTSHYQYTLGIQVPEDEDPITYFLFSDPLPAAHCEFFASGAALLLRAAGVPARYVTGVGVWEKHPFADFWVARNRDAHAWVEAWDDQKGWFIVEATPSNGLPEAGQGEAGNVLSDLWSLLKFQIRRLITALREGAWRVVLEVTATLLLGLYRFVQRAWMPLVLALGLFIFFLRLLRRWRERPARLLPQGELFRRMHRQICTIDKFVKRRHRLERAPHMTPHAFARILETEGTDSTACGRLATWYRSWAEARFQPETDPQAVEALEAQMRVLSATKPSRTVGRS